MVKTVGTKLLLQIYQPKKLAKETLRAEIAEDSNKKLKQS